jgi:hypothetical protein
MKKLLLASGVYVDCGTPLICCHLYMLLVACVHHVTSNKHAGNVLARLNPLRKMFRDFSNHYVPTNHAMDISLSLSLSLSLSIDPVDASSGGQIKDVNALLQREHEELHHPCMIATTQSCTSLTFLYTARLINLHASSSNKTNLNCERKSKW